MTTRIENMMSAANAYNKVADQYDKSFHSNVALAEDDVIYDMMRSWLRPGWTLDLGCGTGQFLEHVGMAKKDYWGFDVSVKMVHVARTKFPGYDIGCVEMETALKLVMPGSASNVVSLFGSCSYADIGIYPLIWRALKPGGRCFLMLFNKRYENRKTYILKRNKIKAPFHTYREARSSWPVMFSQLRALGFNFTGDSLDWAQKSLGLDDVEIQRLITDISAPEALSGSEFSKPWTPTGAPTDNQADVVSMSQEASDKLRVAQKRIEHAKTEQDREAARKDVDIYTVNLIYTGEQAGVIKAVLGNRPAPIILDWCHKAYDRGERFGEKTLN